MNLHSRNGQYDDDDDYPLIVEFLIGLGCLEFVAGGYLVAVCVYEWVKR